MSCHQDNGNIEKKTVVQHISFEQSEEDIEPPPPKFSTTYKSVEEWLTDICTNEKNPKAISNYNIGLFELQDGYVLFLVGTNDYEIDKTHSETHNDFMPANMYFKIPKTYYDHLTREALLQKLVLDLTNFTKTNTFKNSFLTQSNQIIFRTTGKKIWAKDPV